MQEYFDEHDNFQGYYFRRWFKMFKPLYERIVEDLMRECSYFLQRFYVRGTFRFTPLQKHTTALHHITYDIHADAFDESFRMSARIT